MVNVWSSVLSWKHADLCALESFSKKPWRCYLWSYSHTCARSLLATGLFYKKNSNISYLRIQLQEAGFQSISCPISELFQGWLNFVLFNRWLKVNTELVHQRLDLRFHTRDTAIVYFLPAFWLKTIEGRVGFQFLCTCRCVGLALQRSSSSGCEGHLHRRTIENGNLI